MREEEKDGLATVLYYADKLKFQIPPLSGRWPELCEDDGYEIQERLTRKFLAEGRVMAGRKIGGISYLKTAGGGFGPHSGILWKDRILPEGSVLPCGAYLSPGVEAEVAITVSRDLAVGPVTAELAEAAIGQLLPAWEIVESRVIRQGKTLPDSLADNAAYGGCVLGPAREAEAFRGQKIGISLYKNGAPLAVSTGTVDLGQLAASLAWLANHLIRRGGGIRKGECILTGALTKPLLPLERGDTLSARFEGLGEATITGG